MGKTGKDQSRHIDFKCGDKPKSVKGAPKKIPRRKSIKNRNI